MANKKKSTIVKLRSTASSYFYTTEKNPKMEGGANNDGKLYLKKYDPIVRKHVPFKEAKIK